MQAYSGPGYAQQYHSVAEEDYSCKDDYYYNNGSTMYMKPNQHIIPPNQSFYHMQKNGGYDQNHGNFKHGHEGYNTQYSDQSWYEKEQRQNSWKLTNEYTGQGGMQLDAHNKYSGGMSHFGEIGGGYGTHQGHWIPMIGYPRPVCPQPNKPFPVWNPKGVRD